MEKYILIIAVIIVVAVVYLIATRLAEANKYIPEPMNGQIVLDNLNKKWVYLRALNNGTFLFRTPNGRIDSITLERCKYLGFLKQYDFESVQK